MKILQLSMFKQLILAILVILPLTGCGYVDRLAATATGYSILCVNGVEYIQFTSGASVAYTNEGKIKTC
jgi:hypothetical protein